MAKRYGAECANAVLLRTFNGIPIVDAKADFTLMVRTSSVKAAEGQEKDAANCILAKACREQVGASIVAFFRRVAYLELPDSRGRKRVVRYKLDDDAAAIVAAFDRGKSVRGEVMVTLKAPRKSESLDAVRKKSRDLRERHRAAILNGIIIEKGSKSGPSPHKAKVLNLDVRNGQGLVHNSIKKGVARRLAKAAS